MTDLTINQAWPMFGNEFIALQGRTKESFDRYTTAKNHLVRFAGNVKIQDLTAQLIAGWSMDMTKNGLSATTVNIYLNMLASFCKWAYRNDYLPRNPFDGIKRQRPEAPPPRPLRWSEAIVAVENIAGLPFWQRDRAFVDFILRTGCRRSEAMNLHVEALDLMDGKVTFTKTKGKRARVVFLGPELRQRLAEYLAYRNMIWPGNDLLFPSNKGLKMRGNYVNKIVHKYGIKATLHRFRHTFGTEMVRRTGNLRLTQELMGHASPVTTAGYLQVWDEDKQTAANLLDGDEGVQGVNKRAANKRAGLRSHSS